MSGKKSVSLRHYLEYGTARVLIGIASFFPYPFRVAAAGWLGRRVVGPVVGWNRRVRENLAYVWPDASNAKVKSIVAGATDNAGRAVIESWSASDVLDRVRGVDFTGPGASALSAARDAGSPIILAASHFGNYLAFGAALNDRGFPVAALYKPMTNPLFNEAYVRAIGKFCSELHPTDRRGVSGLARTLKSGGIVAILLDVHQDRGAILRFLGKPAKTATSAADWANKYNALLVPAYAIRTKDGLGFQLWVDAPVDPSGDPLEVTQALCDSLERQIEERPEQWFWIHRRWKVEADAPGAPDVGALT